MQSVGTETEDTGHARTENDVFHARFCFARIFTGSFFTADFTADFQDFCSRPAFRIGKIAIDDHGPAKGNGEQYAQRTAAGAEKQCLPERKSLPVSKHEQAGKDKDNS